MWAWAAWPRGDASVGSFEGRPEHGQVGRDELTVEAIGQRDWERVDALRKQQDAIGSACYHFLHEYSPNEDARPVQLHPQVLSDSATVVEFGNRFYSLWHVHA